MKKRLALACCKLYISTGLDAKSTDLMEWAANKHRRFARLLHTFKDEQYNRVGYTLAGECTQLAFRNAIVDLVRTAIESINLAEQSGSHPRLGVVDHICFHPLGREATLEQAASLARSCAEAVGNTLQVPTYIYGAASPENESLDSIRRKLGYFKPTIHGLWQGAPHINLSITPPHFGPCKLSPRTGIVIIGACPWVANYNVPLVCKNLELARVIAKKVSQRGGGLPHVQAMALLHGEECVEIACNLLDVDKTSAVVVQNYVENLAKEYGLKEVKPGYFTNLTEEYVYKMAESMIDISN